MQIEMKELPTIKVRGFDGKHHEFIVGRGDGDKLIWTIKVWLDGENVNHRKERRKNEYCNTAS